MKFIVFLTVSSPWACDVGYTGGFKSNLYHHSHSKGEEAGGHGQPGACHNQPIYVFLVRDYFSLKRFTVIFSQKKLFFVVL